jgi:hypothetical protein
MNFKGRTRNLFKILRKLKKKYLYNTGNMVTWIYSKGGHEKFSVWAEFLNVKYPTRKIITEKHDPISNSTAYFLQTAQKNVSHQAGSIAFITHSSSRHTLTQQ